MAKQQITPCLRIEKDAKKAAKYYLSVFKKGKLKSYRAYKNSPNPAGDFDVAEIELAGMNFQILAAGPLFKFNEAVSFMIRCKDQAEIDYYWRALTAGGGREGSCGWLKDKYGLSWQVVPEQFYQLASHKNRAKRQYAFTALMKMKKIIIADLEEK